jgi:CheY-like chemotaxis protein
MPQIDGFTLAEWIKHDGEVGSTVVMMLTSGGQPEDSRRCEELGIAAYLLKPIKQSELLEAIELALGIAGPKAEAAEPAAGRGSRVGSLRILLAEDSLVNQKLAVALLEGCGHTVTVANNGREAAAVFDAQAFDLVLMDVQMPEMDGLEATSRIRDRENQAGSRVPIIAMTAHALKGDRERCLDAGMDGYIAKPIHAEELFETIERVFSDRKSAKPAEDASPGQGINWAEALKTTRGNRATLNAMAEAALEEIPRLMAAIRQAVAQGDRIQLRLSAHTLKGSIRYFGASQAFQYAARLEELGQEGSLEMVAPILAALEAETAAFIAAVREYVQEPKNNCDIWP